MLGSLLYLLALPAAAPDRLADVPARAAHIDSLAEKHWQAEGIRPAPLADDSTFLRRVTLDLLGRIPTPDEARTFAADSSPDKRQRAVRRLLASPEYSLHLGRVLDDMIQEKYAGDGEFLEYLRKSVAAHRGWDRMFRDMLLGPWNVPESKAADRFLLKRVKNIDDLTNDTARVFFGVNVSCAKCHDHPLVADWKQDHYYGLASFFQRTYEASKGGRDVKEKPAGGDVMFVTTRGERRTARLLFLSSGTVKEPAPDPKAKKAAVSRRQLLVEAALTEKRFFNRAIVNRMWAYLLGRGLVHPVDQMHSANPPVIPDLLEWLGDDFAAHGYDLDGLVASIVSSRVYQRASLRDDADEPSDPAFARAMLRPLTPRQYALSLLLAAGDESFAQAKDEPARGRLYRDLEGRTNGLIGVLDPRTDRFQSSAGEALFMSNHPEVQRLVGPAGNNLAARLAKLSDSGQAVETATWTILSRAPTAEERTFLVRWLDQRKDQRARACGDLVWALATSAEFRFNH
jgi:hypothetical protein